MSTDVASGSGSAGNNDNEKGGDKKSLSDSDLDNPLLHLKVGTKIEVRKKMNNLTTWHRATIAGIHKSKLAGSNDEYSIEYPDGVIEQMQLAIERWRLFISE